jgi:hypothetical protein
MARFKDLIEPMTLGNMRATGVRSLDVSCWNCHYREPMRRGAGFFEVLPIITVGERADLI